MLGLARPCQKQWACAHRTSRWRHPARTTRTFGEDFAGPKILSLRSPIILNLIMENVHVATRIYNVALAALKMKQLFASENNKFLEANRIDTKTVKVPTELILMLRLLISL